MVETENLFCDDCLKDPAIAALDKLIRLGLVEAAGERRPNADHAMEQGWQLSALGHMVAQCQQRLGLSFEHARGMVKGLEGGCMA